MGLASYYEHIREIKDSSFTAMHQISMLREKERIQPVDLIDAERLLEGIQKRCALFERRLEEALSRSSDDAGARKALISEEAKTQSLLTKIGTLLAKIQALQCHLEKSEEAKQEMKLMIRQQLSTIRKLENENRRLTNNVKAVNQHKAQLREKLTLLRSSQRHTLLTISKASG